METVCTPLYNTEWEATTMTAMAAIVKVNLQCPLSLSPLSRLRWVDGELRRGTRVEE